MGVLIPNQYFYIWTGSSFPYLNLLAVKSLLLVDTSATVVVYIVGPEPQNGNFENLRVLERVSIVGIEPDDVFSELPTDVQSVGAIFHKIPESSASARSNILRYALLYLNGGVYLDFDTVVTRSLSDLAGHQSFVGEENVWVGDEDRVAGKWWVCLYPRNLFWLTSWLLRRADSAWFSGKLQLARFLQRTDAIWSKKQPNNAVMGAVTKSPFIRELLLACLNTDFTVRYATGPTLVSQVAAHFPHLVSVLPVNYFYSVAPGESFRFFSDQTLTLPTEAYLIHYAASNHKKLIPTIDATCSWTRSSHTVMADLITGVESQYAAVKNDSFVSSIAKQPLISCLMVTANRAEIARVAIECFSEQTWSNKELVIIDDGEEDYSDMIASFDCADRVRYIKLQPANPRLSLGELRNLSIDEAHGEWCVQWDDDEWYHPERLAIQISAMVQSHKAACALKWTLMHIDSDDLVNHPFRADAGLATPGTIVHRRTHARYPAQRKGEDSVFIRAVKDMGGLCVLDQQYSHLFIRCFHGNNTWDFEHFLKRLRRTPRGLVSLLFLKLLRRPITSHYAFDLSATEVAAINEFKSDTFGLLIHAN
ncbi:MAG: glycosyltransferase [Actinobacteria bacterium]|nr:glycosyltransferase [Actinomycetota bacterium]